MPEFFHVDRSNALSAGSVIDLEQQPNFEPAELRAVAEDLFPDGLTRFGWRYLWQERTSTETLYETVFELVRRAEFPDCPSRWQAVFACETLDDARTFRLRYPGPNGVSGQIFVVSAAESFRCNLPLIDFGASTVVGVAGARAYWGGERGYAAELWEHLLIPPVTVLRPAE